jgi:transposase
LQLLWEEYRTQEPEGYAYSRFCELYGAWKDTQDVVLRQEHRAGEKLFVDWAGAKIPIYHREAGEIDSASLFVAVMGASSYTFVHATRNQDLRSWIDCHVRAFEFLEGVPKLVIPDAGAAESSPFSQAGGHTRLTVRRTGSTGAAAAAGGTL